ncbi:MAG: hypothetical protein MUO27_02130 [Sedimentisphaerales bacterium]|nr:hypothetical protein [Sedimentisphaerales bacterium]
MTEIKKTLEILKARWPEVMFIIALDVLSFSINMSQTIFHPIGQMLRILITLVFISFTIIIFMLIIGFQRTVYLEDRKRQSPLVLLREGKYFFLPLAGLGIIYGLALACLQILVLWAIKHAAPDFMDTRWGASLVYQLPSTSVSLILMKPILLIFPLIIVLDCSILKSLKMLGRCRLRDARELVILFLVSLGLPFLWTFLPSPHGMTISHYLLTASHIIPGQFIDLMIAVMAIRFVASRNLIYDNGSKPLDSLNPSI